MLAEDRSVKKLLVGPLDLIPLGLLVAVACGGSASVNGQAGGSAGTTGGVASDGGGARAAGGRANSVGAGGTLVDGGAAPVTCVGYAPLCYGNSLQSMQRCCPLYSLGTATCENGKWTCGDAPAPGCATCSPVGAGTPLIQCVDAVCAAGQACVAYRTIGNFFQGPDGGACAAGRHLEGQECQPDFAYTCAALVGCEEFGPACACAPETACAQATDCAVLAPAAWLDPAAQIECELLVP